MPDRSLPGPVVWWVDPDAYSEGFPQKQRDISPDCSIAFWVSPQGALDDIYPTEYGLLSESSSWLMKIYDFHNEEYRMLYDTYYDLRLSFFKVKPLSLLEGLPKTVAGYTVKLSPPFPDGLDISPLSVMTIRYLGNYPRWIEEQQNDFVKVADIPNDEQGNPSWRLAFKTHLITVGDHPWTGSQWHLEFLRTI